MSRLVAFKPIFPSPFGYCNFGEENRELNQQLIKDIDYDRSVGTGKQRSFKPVSYTHLTLPTNREV